MTKKAVALLITLCVAVTIEAQANKPFSTTVVVLTAVQKQDGAAVAAMVKGQRECQLLGKVVFAPPQQSTSGESPGGWFVHFKEHACADEKGRVAMASVFGVIELARELPRGSEVTVNGVR